VGALQNKPFFLSEFGTMVYGWGHDDAGPASYQSGLKNASLVLRGINAGVTVSIAGVLPIAATWNGQWQLSAPGTSIVTDCWIPLCHSPTRTISSPCCHAICRSTPACWPAALKRPS